MNIANSRNIPYRQIALKAKVDQRTVSKYLKGEFVRYNKAVKICKAINIMTKEIDKSMLLTAK